jgi:hypothetical protein
VGTTGVFPFLFPPETRQFLSTKSGLSFPKTKSKGRKLSIKAYGWATEPHGMGTLVTSSTESTTEVVSYTQPDSAKSSTKELEDEGFERITLPLKPSPFSLLWKEFSCPKPSCTSTLSRAHYRGEKKKISYIIEGKLPKKGIVTSIKTR